MNLLADELGESARVCASVSLLRRGLCRASVVGPPVDFSAALVSFDFMADEPIAFGQDVDALVALLAETDRPWGCVETTPDIVESLGERVRIHFGGSVRYYDAVYLSMEGPAVEIPNDDVRLLTIDDAELWSSVAEEDMQSDGFGDVETHLREGIAAAAIVDGQIVSIAQASGVTEQYADIGIFTLEPYRRKGYASACVSLAAREAKKWGLTPAWSTGVDNAGSLSVRTSGTCPACYESPRLRGEQVFELWLF